jgi:nitric oxide dioxygenase
MTGDQIALVKHSWKVFRDIDPAIIGDVFYSKLFVEAPYVRHMFKTPRPAQSKKLIDMISMIVGRLDRLSELTEDIKKLAVRHVDYGVKPSHYKAVGIALLWTLQQGLGKDWNDATREAWESCYKMLSDTMIDAADYTQREAI